MNDLEYYAALINGIFGPGTATFDTAAGHSNHVIGALNHTGDFDAFKLNFAARLKRLQTVYLTHPDLPKVLVKVNEISSKKNWHGAYAELAAYDHLNSNLSARQPFLTEPVIPELILPKEDSFAAEHQKTLTDLDGFIDEFNLCFDIKVLKDNIDEILQGIYAPLIAKHNGLGHIAAEYDMTISFGVLQQKRTDLLSELDARLSANPQLRRYHSKQIPELSFVFTWQAGVSTAVRSYGPYGHAKNHHQNIFIYAGKFLKTRPTMIVLVSFPWYNQVLNQQRDLSVFQRAYARRVFCQYIHDFRPFTIYNPKFSGTETIYEMSTHLSGIIFLDDNAILSDDPGQTNVRCSVFLNPNAKHKLAGSLAIHYLDAICNLEFDDFKDDNY